MFGGPPAVAEPTPTVLLVPPGSEVGVRDEMEEVEVGVVWVVVNEPDNMVPVPPAAVADVDCDPSPVAVPPVDALPTDAVD